MDVNVSLARQACQTQVNQALVIIENKVCSLARYKYPARIPFPVRLRSTQTDCKVNLKEREPRLLEGYKAFMEDIVP